MRKGRKYEHVKQTTKIPKALPTFLRFQSMTCH